MKLEPIKPRENCGKIETPDSLYQILSTSFSSFSFVTFIGLETRLGPRLISIFVHRKRYNVAFNLNGADVSFRGIGSYDTSSFQIALSKFFEVFR